MTHNKAKPRRGRKASASRRRYFYWKYRKAHPESGFVKPLSKEDAARARAAHISNDEYRYESACSYAILMGEPLPNKKEFMADLARRRARK